MTAQIPCSNPACGKVLKLTRPITVRSRLVCPACRTEILVEPAIRNEEDLGTLTRGPAAGNEGAKEPALIGDDVPTRTLDADAARAALGTPSAAILGERYAIGSEIARGGMGIVFAAHDQVLNREVALKTVRPNLALSQSAFNRFTIESCITGRLEHPGIPPVHDLGRLPDGRPFLVMKLVRGRTMADLLAARGDLSDRDRWLRTFEQICDAVGFAHAQGIIHRDLKPANVMVGAFGEVQVMDWGLAKDTHGSRTVSAGDGEAGGRDPGSDLTQAGSVLGTPSYMAPEQARGEIDRIGPATDVFALGAILCVILTGRPPYAGESSREVLARAASGDVEDALGRLAKCGAAPELTAIVRGCLAADPASRPSDGRALAEAVARYRAEMETRLRAVEQERVAAEAKAVEARRRRRVQRALGVAIVAIVALVGGGWLWADAQRARRANEASRHVTAALAEAAGLRERAREKPDDLARWDAAITAVNAARVAVAAEEADDAIREHVEAYAASIQEEAAAARLTAAQVDENRRLKDRLEATRFVATTRAQGEKFDDEGQDQAYAALFGELGVVVGEGTPAEAAARLARPLITNNIAFALDDWARSRGKALGLSDPGRIWILQTAIALDKDKLRNQIRSELAAGDQQTVLKRMQSPSTLELPVETLMCLLSAVPDSHDRIAAVLRPVWDKRRDDFWVAVELGRCLLPMGKNEEAAQCFTAAISMRPRASGPYLSLVYALGQLGRYEEAIRVCERAAELEPKNPYPQIQLYDFHMRRRDYQTSKKHAEIANSLAAALPPAEKAWYQHFYAWSLNNSGRPEEAIPQARAVLEFDPKHKGARWCVAQALARTKNFDEAIAEFDRIENPTYQSLNSFGTTLNWNGQAPLALRYLEQALEVSPKTVFIYADLGIAYHRAGKRDEALVTLKRGLELSPRHYWVNFWLGVVHQENGDDRSAVGYFRIAQQVGPNTPDAWERLTFILARLGEKVEAVATGRRAVELGPKRSYAHANLGFALMVSDDLTGALQSVETALELDDKNAFAHQWKADVLNRTGANPEVALVCAKRGLELMPTNPWMQVTLGHALHNLGRVDEAKAAHRDAAQRDPATIRFLLKDYDK